MWDITNNYDIKHYINTLYNKDISSCLLFFQTNINDDYIITSSNYIGNHVKTSGTKIFSLNNGKLIKYIINSNNYYTGYLLSWYNKTNNKYYLIEIAFNNIIINNLLENELYYQSRQGPEIFQNIGFIFNKENNEYLCCSSTNGFILIYGIYIIKIYLKLFISKEVFLCI